MIMEQDKKLTAPEVTFARRGKVKLNDSPLRTDFYSAEDIAVFNARHDAAYGWNPKSPRIYSKNPDRPAEPSRKKGGECSS